MSSEQRRRIFKLTVSAFIVMNVFVIGMRHRPQWLADWAQQTTQTHLSPMNAWRLGLIPFAVHWYSHKAGLDNRWEMYSSLHRFDWTLVAVGIDREGQAVLLPEPMQVPRTWWQRRITDFREAKFQLNIYQWPELQARYASYLHRTYPDNQGVPIDTIRFDLRYRMFAETPVEARQRGTHWAGREVVYPYNTFPFTDEARERLDAAAADESADRPAEEG